MTTRRGFLAGAVGGAVLAPGVAGAARAATAPPGGTVVQAHREVVRRGRAIAASPTGDLLVVAHDERRTVAIVPLGGGDPRLVDAGGQPLHVAVAPDGRTAVVATASWDGPGLAFVDLAAARVVRRVDAGPAPWGVAFTPDGARVVVTGGGQQGTVHVVRAADGAVLASRQVGLLPRGVAVTRSGRSAWVALHGEDRVVRLDLTRLRVRHATAAPAFPQDVALSPDQRRLLVTHGGIGIDHVSELVLGPGRAVRRTVGTQPSAVAWTARGARVVAVGGTGEIVVMARGGRVRRHAVGGAPRGLALAAGRAYTADWLSDRIRSVRA